MLKLSKDRWHDAKLSMFWIGIFTILILGLIIQIFWRNWEETQAKLETCQKNFEVWSEQVESGHVVIELKGGVKGGE